MQPYVCEICLHHIWHHRFADRYWQGAVRQVRDEDRVRHERPPCRLPWNRDRRIDNDDCVEYWN